MTPIHQLLARIRQDPEFGKGDFEIGFLDRVEGTIQRGKAIDIPSPKSQGWK